MNLRFQGLSIFLLLLTLTACGGGGGSESSNKAITPTPNQAPTVTISGFNASGGQIVTLTAQANDSDGTIASYQWSQTAGPSVSLESVSGNELVFTAPYVTSDTEFSFDVLVTDNDGATATQSITITIEPANQAPFITINDVTTAPGQSISITAEVNDIDGEIVSYNWQQKSGTTVELIDADKVTVQFTVPQIDGINEIVLTLTAEDDDGDTSAADVTVQIIDGVASFTISGKVTTFKQSFANIPVQVHVGTQTYLGETNELGNYQINLFGIKDENIDALVKVVATGTATNSIFKLVSYVDTVSNLFEQAKINDYLLTTSKQQSLTVSSFSSAAAALMEQSNDGVAISSFSKLNLLSTQIDTGLLNTYVAMLESLVDDINNPSSLPEIITSGEASNIYQVLVEKEAAQQLYNQLNLNHANSEQQVSELAVDSSIIDTSLAITESTSFYLANEVFLFNTNGTGNVSNDSFSWHETDGVVTISLNEIEDTSVEFSNKYSIHGDYLGAVYGFLTGYKLTLLYSTPSRKQWLVESIYQYHNEDDINSEQVEVDNQALSIAKALHEIGKQPIADTVTVGGELAVAFSHPHPTTFTTYNGEEKTSDTSAMQVNFITQTEATLSYEMFNDSTKNFDSETVNVSWQINNNTLELINDNWAIDIANFGENQTDKNLITVSATYTDVANDISESVNELRYLFASDSSTAAWNDANIPGIYLYQNVRSEINPLDVGWYELREDGTLSYFYVDVNSNETEITSDMVRESPGLWQVTNGELVIRRFRENSSITNSYSTCHNNSWETTLTDNCILYFERAWSLLNQYQTTDGDVNLIRQDSKYYSDFWISAQDRENYGLGDERQVDIASSILSDFIKLEERPLTLPDDYILIKDRN